MYGNFLIGVVVYHNIDNPMIPRQPIQVHKKIFRKYDHLINPSRCKLAV